VGKRSERMILVWEEQEGEMRQEEEQEGEMREEEEQEGEMSMMVEGEVLPSQWGYGEEQGTRSG
jgi:hypothetical protein